MVIFHTLWYNLLNVTNKTMLTQFQQYSTLKMDFHLYYLTQDSASQLLPFGQTPHAEAKSPTVQFPCLNRYFFRLQFPVSQELGL